MAGFSRQRNPRRLTRIKPIMHGYWPRQLPGGGQFSLLRRASCIGIMLSLGTAEPAIRPSKMKSTKVQNPLRIYTKLHRVAYYANARARKLATPHG